MDMLSRCVGACSTPAALRRIHGWGTIVWLVLAVPAVFFWRDSVPFLVFISIYAVVVSHWSGWQAARVEVVQDEDANVAEVLAEVRELKRWFMDAEVPDGAKERVWADILTRLEEQP